jgi:uncharacterized YigZ family protein
MSPGATGVRKRAVSESRYPIPTGIHRVQETIQRSRFITTVSHAPSATDAHAFVKQIKSEFPDATHNCWAFAAGPPGSTSHVGLSDDGEPHNTAGKPMLNALIHSGVGEIVAVCTRYFGGVKLGTGGLSRAYASGVKLALDGLPTEARIERVGVEVVIGYENVTELQRIMAEMEVVVDGEEYGERVLIRCAVPTAALESFAAADATSGAGSVTRR